MFTLIHLFLCLCLTFTTTPIQALDNGLGLTPPMGFNPWNCFGKDRSGHCKLVNPDLPSPGCIGFNESVILSIADALVSTGLRDAGYEYVCKYIPSFVILSLLFNNNHIIYNFGFLGQS